MTTATPTRSLLANAEISRRILTEKMNGATTAQAIDTVLGAGTHARIASEVYDALRAREVAEGRAVCAAE